MLFSTKLRWLFTAFTSLLVLVPAAARSDAAAPLSAYGALPDVENAAISPSGNNVALITTIGDSRLILFLGPDMKPMRKMELGDTKVRQLDWIGEDRVLMLTSSTEDLYGFSIEKLEVYDAHIIPATFDGEITTIFDRESGLMDAVFGTHGTRYANGRWSAYFGALEVDRDQRQGFRYRGPFLYRFDVAEGRSTRIATASAADTRRDWLIGPQGTVESTFDSDVDSGKWSIRNSQGNTIASGKHSGGQASLVGLGYGGASLIYSEGDDDNLINWFEVPLSGGEPKPFLHDVEIDRLYFDEITGNLIGYLTSNGAHVFADSNHQAAVDRVRRTFAKYDLEIADWSTDFKRILLRTSGNNDSGTWYLFDREKMQASAIAFERRKIEPHMVGPISTFEYVAADGLKMDGILTLPPGREAKDLPLVMLPHGGPYAHDEAEFNWWAQAFASRGYAVLQPNFRGSTNRDQAFRLAGSGEWGRKMQSDISDGMAALADAGIIDPDRTCIAGASYGGYAALAGVTLQQGLYRCAVAVAPVSDLDALFEQGYEDRGRWRVTKSRFLDMLGPKDRWDEVSPLRQAGNADAPIMLIHGRDDTVVPYSHSRLMADKLKDHGKPHEFLQLEGEDHWLSQSETRQKMLSAAVGFVEKHNPPD